MKAIPHQIGGNNNDALRFGFHGVKSDILEPHPLQSAYNSVSFYLFLSSLSLFYAPPSLYYSSVFICFFTGH